MKPILVSVLLLSLLSAGLVTGQQAHPQQVVSPKPTLAAAPASQNQGVQATPSNSNETRARSHSYRREVSPRRHHSSISKQEKVFLVGVVGTSMGIGALAGGPKGLAIGAIVGGWGAYAAHRFWHWLR